MRWAFPLLVSKRSPRPRARRPVGALGNRPRTLPESTGRNSGVIEPSQADDAVRWNEERYRTLFDLGPVAVYSCDASGVIQEFNHRAVELWGCEPAPGDTDKRFCGSFKLFRPDGSFMPHELCPMADVVTGSLSEARDAEVII